MKVKFANILSGNANRVTMYPCIKISLNVTINPICAMNQAPLPKVFGWKNIQVPGHKVAFGWSYSRTLEQTFCREMAQRAWKHQKTFWFPLFVTEIFYCRKIIWASSWSCQFLFLQWPNTCCIYWNFYRHFSVFSADRVYGSFWMPITHFQNPASSNMIGWDIWTVKIELRFKPFHHHTLEINVNSDFRDKSGINL